MVVVVRMVVNVVGYGLMARGLHSCSTKTSRGKERMKEKKILVISIINNAQQILEINLTLDNNNESPIFFREEQT